MVITWVNKSEIPLKYQFYGTKDLWSQLCVNIVPAIEYFPDVDIATIEHNPDAPEVCILVEILPTTEEHLARLKHASMPIIAVTDTAEKAQAISANVELPILVLPISESDWSLLQKYISSQICYNKKLTNNVILAEGSADVLILADDNLAIVAANKIAREQLQLSEQQAVSGTVSLIDYVADEDKHVLYNPKILIRKGNAIEQTVLLRLKTLSGIHSAQVRIKSVQISEQTMGISFAARMTDIQNEVSANLLVSNDRLQRILAASTSVIYNSPLLDDTTTSFGGETSVFISDNAIALLGFSAEELLNDSSLFPSRIHLDDNEEYFSGLGTLMEEGKHSREFRFQHKNGEWIWIEEQMNIRQHPTGNYQEIIGSWQNITARKLYEQELQQLNGQLQEFNAELEHRVKRRTEELEHSKQRLDMFLRRSADAVTVLNSDFEIVFESEAITAISKYPVADRIGKKIFFDAKDTVLMEENRKLLQRLQSNGTTLIEWEAVRADGSVYVVETAASNQLHNPSIQGYVLNSRDISVRRQAARQMEMALEKERLLKNMTSDIITTISHEYRTPLTTVLASVSMFEQHWQKLTDEKRTSIIERGKKSVLRIKELVEKTVVIATLEQNFSTEQKVNIVWNQFLDSELEPIRQEFPEHSIQVEYRLSPEEMIWGTYPGLLRLIIIHLVQNACKFSPKNMPVNITIAKNNEQGYVEISVADKGIGIELEDQKKIFNAFYKRDEQLNNSGLGVGLAIVQKAVILFEGVIQVDSMPQQGTTFTILLPE